MLMWLVSNVILLVSLQGCQQPAQAAMLILYSMLECLGWIVPYVIQQTIGLHHTMEVIPGLLMRAGEGLIMEALPVETVIPKIFEQQPAWPVIVAIIQMVEVMGMING